MTALRAQVGRTAPWCALFLIGLLVCLSALSPAPPVAAAPAQPLLAADGDSIEGARLLGLPYAFGYSDTPVVVPEGGWALSAIYPLGAPTNAVVEYIDVNNVTISGPGAAGVTLRFCPIGADLSNCVPVQGSDTYHLTDFAGRAANGAWTLRFTDPTADGNVGTLSYWAIRVYYSVPAGAQPTATPTPPDVHSVTLTAIADTMTSSGNQNGNYGSAATLSAGYMQTLRAWYKFDLSSIPANAYGISAELDLYRQQGGSVSLDVFVPLADWQEKTLTWSNQPSFDPNSMGSKWISGQPPKFERWNVSGLAQQWVAGLKPNYGFMLTDHNDARSAVFASRESTDARHRPLLYISYFLPPPTPGSPTATPTITATPTPTNTPLPYMKRVNAGGPAYTDSHGQLWDADQAYAAGGWGYVGGGTYATTHAIANTPDPLLYQSERFWNASALPGYRFTVPVGWYQVTLRFAEIYRDSVGSRVFGINAESVTQLENYDPLVAAGGKNKAAPDVTFVVPVSDGVLDIGFIRYVDRDGPKLSAIEVLPMGQTGATFTPTPTSTPAAPTETPTVTPTARPYEQRVNAGGPAYTDALGAFWAADKPYAPGDWGYVGGFTYATSHAIANTDDDPLYQSERFWSGSGSPGYVFSVPNGTYVVTLKFAEIYRNSGFTRRFDVIVERIPVRTELDIWFSAGGRYIAMPDLTVIVPVSDGHVTVDFLALPGYDGPKINAISVVQQ